MRDDRLTTLLSMLDGVRSGEFWIGSTSAGRRRIDRMPLLEELLEAAIILEEASVPTTHKTAEEA